MRLYSEGRVPYEGRWEGNEAEEQIGRGEKKKKCVQGGLENEGRGKKREENTEDEEGGDGAEDVLFWFLWHFLSNEAVN